MEFSSFFSFSLSVLNMYWAVVLKLKYSQIMPIKNIFNFCFEYYTVNDTVLLLLYVRIRNAAAILSTFLLFSFFFICKRLPKVEKLAKALLLELYIATLCVPATLLQQGQSHGWRSCSTQSFSSTHQRDSCGSALTAKRLCSSLEDSGADQGSLLAGLETFAR